MEVPNGLACRYCGRRWFKHDIQVHEKNCYLKCISIIKTLEGRYHKLLLTRPPAWEEWPLPPKVPLQRYNENARQCYNAGWCACDRCQRRFPIQALAEHIQGCTETAPKSRRPGSGTGSARASGAGTAEQASSFTPNWSKPERHTSSLASSSAGQAAGNSEAKIGGSGGYNLDAIDEGPGGDDGRIACRRCGRKFAADRIDRHESVCKALKTEPEKIGETMKKSTRVPDVSEPGSAPKGYVPRGTGKSALKGGGGAPFGGDSSERDDGRVSCRRCGRKFAPDRIDKHESICSGLQNIDPKRDLPIPKKMVDVSPVGSPGLGGGMSNTMVRMRPGAPAPPSSKLAATGPARASPSGVSSAQKRTAAHAPAAPPSGTLPSASPDGPPGPSGPSSGPKFCSECGTKFASSGKFCPECGAKRS